jgi:hypothetical protein
MKRLGTSFSSAEPQEPYPLPCLNLITLITYQFSLLLFVCLACPWFAYYLRTLADTSLLHGCWLTNIRDSVFSFISLYCRTNQICFSPKFVFYSSPPGSCHPLFTFLYPFHLPDFLQPACFSACLFALFVASVASDRWVSWTDGCVDVVLLGHSAALLTHGQQHTPAQAIKHVCGGFPPDRPVRPGNVCASAPLPPPVPVVVVNRKKSRDRY